MHAWVNDGKIHFILPSEHEPEDMGPIYKLSYIDSETLEELRMAARLSLRILSDYERRLAAKLVKEQGEDSSNGS